jgi:hypothetical protein
MKTSDRGFKIFSVTLLALVISVLLNRFIYSAFSMTKAGQIFWYNRDLWKQYWAWLPGKILCITLVLLVLAVICEAVYFIFQRRNK